MQKLVNLLPSKKILVSTCLLVLGVGFSDVVLAQGVGTDSSEAIQGFASILSVFVDLFTFLALLMIDLGGDLLGTEMITGDKPMEAILPMWQFIRNITNIGFVLFMVFLAMANLVSGGQGNWTIKEKLPKMLLAIIAINFSLLGFRVVIDAVNVGTISILSIADSATEKTVTMGQKRDDEGLICGEGGSTSKTCRTFGQRINKLLCKDWNGVGKKPPEGCITGIKLLKSGEIDPDAMGFGGADSMTEHNLFLAFGIHFQEIQKLPQLAANLKSWSGVVDNVLFSAILALAYVVALGAVFVALITRMIMLWVLMVFSPALMAAWVMGFGGGGAGDISSKVVANIIMPLKIAAAFAVSFVLVAVMMEGTVDTQSGFLVVGDALGQFGKNGYGFLWKITTILIFWKAAFWAIDESEAKFITDKIKMGAEATGSFVARAATIDQQILPGVGKSKGKKLALSTLFQAPRLMRQAHQSKMSKDLQELQGMSSLLGGKDAQRLTGALNSLRRKIGSETGKNKQWGVEQMSKYFREVGTKNLGTPNTDEAIDLINGKLGAGVKFNDAQIRTLKGLTSTTDSAALKRTLETISPNANLGTGEYTKGGAAADGGGGGAATPESLASISFSDNRKSIKIGGTPYNNKNQKTALLKDLKAAQENIQGGDFDNIRKVLGNLGINDINGTSMKNITDEAKLKEALNKDTTGDKSK